MEAVFKPVKHSMSFMKMDPAADGGTYVTSSHNINELPEVKEEEQNPISITFPVMKVEVEDDVNFTSAEIDAGTEEYVASTCPENELFDGEDSLLLTRPVSKAENRRELQDLEKMKDVVKEEGNAEDDDTVRECCVSNLTDVEGPSTSRRDMPCSSDSCKKGISQSECVMGHTSRHFTGSDLNSQSCKNGCSGKGNLSRHQGICCSENLFKYDNSKKEMLKNIKELRCQRMPSSENGFRCDTCSKIFAHKHNLVVHQRGHTGDRPFVCDLCGKRFIVSGKLVRHWRTHTGEKCFECDTCGKGFSEKFTLKGHLRIHSGEKLFVCETCGKAFSDRSNFLVHCSRHHGGEERFKCDICGAVVCERRSLERHQRKHSGSGNPFVCDVCEKCFFDKRDIAKHLKTHMSERPFVCVVCGKGFLEKRKLVRHHQRVRFCRKPLKCDICGKLFGSGGSLQKHIRTHR